MSFRSRLQHPVQIQKFGYDETDRYNNPVKSLSATLSVKGWFVWSSTDEDGTDRETRTSKASLTLAPEVSVATDDLILVEGKTFSVTGEPLMVSNHHGNHHQLVHLEVYEG